jgi:hypothetical protein
MRNAYLLTTYKYQTKLNQATNVLNSVGFNLNIVEAIDKKQCKNNPVFSHAQSFISILKKGVQEAEDWFYFFEDDIALIEPIELTEIIEYEKISDKMLYLGCSLGSGKHVYNIKPEGVVSGIKIRERDVYRVVGDIRCTHALGFSKTGATFLLDCIYNNIDKCQENYAADLNLSQLIQTEKLKSFCVRFDLVSPQNKGHKGIFYQDRSVVRTELA